MQEMWVGFLGQEGPLEKKMTTQDSCLEIPWIVFKLGSASINNGTY